MLCLPRAHDRIPKNRVGVAGRVTRVTSPAFQYRTTANLTRSVRTPQLFPPSSSLNIYSPVQHGSSCGTFVASAATGGDSL